MPDHNLYKIDFESAEDMMKTFELLRPNTLKFEYPYRVTKKQYEFLDKAGIKFHFITDA